jgi:transcription initiation factor TFIID subunit 15
MVSTIIVSPQHNENIPKTNSDFNVVLAIDNLDTGHFTNPNLTYYSAPQQLNGNGVIIGHTHVTIQVSPSFGSLRN